MNLSLRPYLCAHSDEKPNDGWIPWAYYSVTCGDTYKTQDAPYIELSRTPGVKVREDRAQAGTLGRAQEGLEEQEAQDGAGGGGILGRNGKDNNT